MASCAKKAGPLEATDLLQQGEHLFFAQHRALLQEVWRVRKERAAVFCDRDRKKERMATLLAGAVFLAALVLLFFSLASWSSLLCAPRVRLLSEQLPLLLQGLPVWIARL